MGCFIVMEGQFRRMHKEGKWNFLYPPALEGIPKNPMPSQAAAPQQSSPTSPKLALVWTLGSEGL